MNRRTDVIADDDDAFREPLARFFFQSRLDRMDRLRGRAGAGADRRASSRIRCSGRSEDARQRRARPDSGSPPRGTRGRHCRPHRLRQHSHHLAATKLGADHQQTTDMDQISPPGTDLRRLRLRRIHPCERSPSLARVEWEHIQRRCCCQQRRFYWTMATSLRRQNFSAFIAAFFLQRKLEVSSAREASPARHGRPASPSLRPGKSRRLVTNTVAQRPTIASHRQNESPRNNRSHGKRSRTPRNRSCVAPILTGVPGTIIFFHLDKIYCGNGISSRTASAV